jgi:hypothetical protein
MSTTKWPFAHGFVEKFTLGAQKVTFIGNQKLILAKTKLRAGMIF